MGPPLLEMLMRYFEDLVEGHVEESGQRNLTREEILAFAAQYDRQSFRADEEAAQQSVFGDVVASLSSSTRC